MTVIILKELKRNLKWALLACAGWSLCLFAFARVSVEPTLAYREMLSFPVQAVTVLLFPLVGFLLGLVQTLPESRRDAWAFLVHRPLSRGRIFWSKATAGLLLYSLAILAPVIVFLLWLLLPGRLALPFEWGVLLAPLSDLATGTVYYFTGLLVAMRQARWFGTRLWPLLAAVLVSVLVCHLGGWPGDSIWFFSMTLWPYSRLILLAVAAGLVVAAYGAFQSGGTLARQPRACQWGLALSLTVTGCILFAVCLAAATGSADRFLSRGERRAEALANADTVPQKVTRVTPPAVTEDGSVVCIVYADSASSGWPEAGRRDQPGKGPAPTIVAVLDPSGESIPKYKDYTGKLVAELKGERLQMRPLDWVSGVTRPLRLPRRYRQEAAHFVHVWHGESESAAGSMENWLYYPGRGRFYGYSEPITHREPQGLEPRLPFAPLGSAGPDGFQPPAAQDGPRFPLLLSGFDARTAYGENSVLWLATESNVWWMDFRTRETQRVLSLPEGETIAATSSVHGQFGEAWLWQPQALAVIRAARNRFGTAPWWDSATYERDRTSPVSPEDFYVLTESGHLLLLSRSEGTLADVALSVAVGPEEMIRAGRITGRDRIYVETIRSFLEFSKGGEVLARFAEPEHFPLERYVTPEAPADSSAMATIRTVVVRPDASVPALRLTGVAVGWIEYAMSPRVPGSLPSWMSMASMCQYAWPSLACALVALVLCYWWARKRSLPRDERIAWLLAALAFGPGVLLALWGFYDSPAKEPCPACGRKRLVTGERCEHCGAAFAPPAPTGIEILEPAE